MKTQLFRLLSISFIFGNGLINAQTVNVTFTELESSSGQIVMGIYRDSDSWSKEEPGITKSFPKGSSVSGSTLKVSFTLTPGTYGLSIVDDENADSKMNYNWLGLPKEGFGFSNLYHTGWSKPKFNDFSFYISKGQTIAVTIKVRYL
jgi:uncharacterized protein (DUF2141 family)